MLSTDAYEVASVIVLGGLTVHDLKGSIATEGQAAEKVDVLLRRSLRELAKCGYLIWSYEPDSGNLPAVSLPTFDERELDKYWQLCFPNGIPVSKIPDSTIPDSDNPKLYLEDDDALLHEPGNPEYEYLN